MFQSTHSLRSATGVTAPKHQARKEFQSTHSLRSATPTVRGLPGGQAVSIHALLAECDMASPFFPGVLVGFNPRTPCGVRHQVEASGNAELGFNPRTPCGVRPVRGKFLGMMCMVSIHALLAECDPGPNDKHPPMGRFNPRTPCGVRLETSLLGAYPKTFQSTHSLRSATMRLNGQHFVYTVSIHALLAECD